MRWDAVVIGAGPGGCAVAWHLATAGWRVLLAERAQYPADKLCGEFWSHEGVACLKRMGLAGELETFPAIRSVRVSTLGGRVWQEALPAAGLGGSRRRLDQLLLENCRRAGVEIRSRTRVRSLAGDCRAGFWIEWDSPAGRQQVKARLAVVACGKQARIEGLPTAKPSKPSDLMALKVHLDGVCAEGVELHGFDGGYAGLNAVEGERTNLCMLLKTSVFKACGSDPAQMAQQRLAPNPLLARCLAACPPAWERGLAVANLRFGSGSWGGDGIPRVGDAAAAVAPLCGDGMSMALLAGETLGRIGDGFLRGDLPGERMLARYQRDCRRQFRLRLGLGAVLQKVLLSPAWAAAALGLMGQVPSVGRAFIRWTRSGPEVEAP